MKKYPYFFLLSTCLVISSCGKNETASIEKLETTISSLQKENKILKEQLGQNESSEGKTQSSAEKVNSDEKYGLNDSFSFGSGDVEMGKIKITEVTTNQSSFPDHMISIDDYDTTKMIAVTIEYTNVGIEDGFLAYANYFQAYDDNGKSLTQVSQQSGQESVSIGRTGVTTLYWELPVIGSEFNHVEIDFVPDGSKIATFDLAVTH